MPLFFITGSAVRLGRGLAVEAAKMGCDIALVYNSSEDDALDTCNELKSFGIKVALCKADVTKKHEIESAFNMVIEEIGTPDVLINNAGVFPPQFELADITEEIWDRTIDTNTKGAFLCSQAFAKIAKKGARIINIGSVGGLEIWKQRIPYNVSKAGLLQLTKALARELAPGISVNCVNPGVVVMPDDSARHDTSLPDAGSIPMKRYASVGDVFSAVRFFATCSNYITGQMLNIDGGLHDGR